MFVYTSDKSNTITYVKFCENNIYLLRNNDYV